MLTRQESLFSGLDGPGVMRLLQSSVPAYVTCAGDDGARRIVRVPFHWDGTELVLCPLRHALAVPVFPDSIEVSVSIDSDAPPWTVLLIRGPAWVDPAALGAPEVVRIRPSSVGVLDFQASGADDRHPLLSRP